MTEEGINTAPALTAGERLVVVFATTATEEPPPLPLGDEAVTIGRVGGTAALGVDDAEVSRVHAIVGLVEGERVIDDAGSRNGTYVNGARLTKRQRLSPGDVIRVGGTLIVYALADRITEGAPLRERRQAIVPVIREVAPDVELDADAVEALLLHDWPGDGEELRQVVEAAAPSAGEHLGLAHLPEALRPVVEERARAHAEGLARLVSGSLARPTLPPLASKVDRERGPGHDHLVAALREHGFNVARCARYFSVSRRDVYRWIEAEALDLEALRDDRDRLTEALERAGGRATVAAELMGVDRKTIYRMAQREGIDLEGLER